MKKSPLFFPQVAIANEDGVLHVFFIRNGDIQTVFKTTSQNKITRVELGGAVGSNRDRIFISSESEILGFTKKGKQFLGFDTNLTEPIKSMYDSINVKL